ncbi:MAG: hypothetical protein HYT70_03435 [Candidatus Aenigmarchaeota archaeon]|nr:hypothetical protein [Candidatus Aenigmarchaeota archaeon]
MIGTYVKPIGDLEEAILPVLAKLGTYNPQISFVDTHTTYSRGPSYSHISTRSFYIPIDGRAATELELENLEQYLQASSDGLKLRLQKSSIDLAVPTSGPHIQIRYYSKPIARKFLGFPINRREVLFSQILITLAEPSPPVTHFPTIEPIKFESLERTVQQVESYRAQLKEAEERTREIKAVHEKEVIDPLRRLFDEYEKLILELGYQKRN